jgi:hypothetical protein
LLTNGGRIERTRTHLNGTFGLHLTLGTLVIDTSWFEDGLNQTGGSMFALTCFQRAGATICPP